MKRCHLCERIYADSLVYCLDDGAELKEATSNFAETETLVRPLESNNLNSSNTNYEPLQITPDLFRIYCLFGYEKFMGKDSILWRDPQKFHNEATRIEMKKHLDSSFPEYENETFDEIYNQWLWRKRKFSQAEIISSEWYEFNALSDLGFNSYNFKSDNTYDLVRESDERDWGAATWDTGTWSLIDGVLRMKHGYNSLYVTDIFAAKDGFHSAVNDDRDGTRDHYSVFIKPQK